MGWFSSLFNKKAELQTAYADVTELQQWFESKSEALMDTLRDSIKEDLQTIDDELAGLKKASRVLEEAKLRNDNIPERAIHIMEGNRRSYISAISNFISNVKTPSAINFNTVSDFVSSFEDSITMLSKTSAKNFHILQEFFAHESGAMAQGVKNIDITVRGLLDNDYKKVHSAMQNIGRISELLRKKETAEVMLSDNEREASQLLREMEQAKEAIDGLKKTRDYLFHLETEKNMKGIASRIKDAERRLSEVFSPLERPMKKFAKMSAEGEDILAGYVESPVKALPADRELKIIGLLSKMKSVIESGELEIKDRAREKALAQIAVINHDLLKAALNEHLSLKELYSESEKSLKMNPVMHRQSEYEYKLAHLKDKLEKTQKNVEKLKKYTEMPEMDDALSLVKRDVKDILNIELRIKNGSRMMPAKQAAIEAK